MADLARPTVFRVDPAGVDAGPQPLALAQRPIDLRGKRLGLLDNTKENSEFMLRAIAGILDKEFQFSEVYFVRKHSADVPPRPEVLAQLHRQTDAVITGIGD